MNPEPDLTLSREDLYELVWSKPMAELAEDFGLSVDKRAILTRYGGKPASKIDHPVPCVVYLRGGHWGVVRGNDREDPPTAVGEWGVDQRHCAGAEARP